MHANLIGSYRFHLLSIATAGFQLHESVRPARLDELDDLEPLLAEGDHLTRIAKGDLCLVVLNEFDHPVGLQWVNLVRHVDTYLGSFSKPIRGMAYVNQTIIAAADRGKRYGRSLMLGTLGHCATIGIGEVRLAVAYENERMQLLCQRVGFERLGSQVGLRVGGLTVRINLRQS